MRKYRIELVQKDINSKKTSPEIKYFEIMATDKEDAKERFYNAAGQDANLFILNIEEIELNRPELKNRKRKAGPINNGLVPKKHKADCKYCTVSVAARKPVIKIRHKNISYFINDDYHLENAETGELITNIPIIQCPICGKKF